MSDTEVENVLREIRERVRAETAPHAPLTTGAAARGGIAQRADEEASEARARMEANLATTERAWSRLPPLLSNRTGWVARLELWLKRIIKRALHWFTWEQVNFNSAAHYALRDALAALSVYERQLDEARAEASAMRAQMEELSAQVEGLSAELADTRAGLISLRQSHAELTRRMESEGAKSRASLDETAALLETEVARFHDALASSIAQLRDEGNALTGSITQLRDEGNALAGSITQLRDEGRSLAESIVQLRDEQHAFATDASAERQAQLAGLQRELHELTERLREELRVSFRQLSLEAGEAAVMQDRARRQIEARLEMVEKKVRSQKSEVRS